MTADEALKEMRQGGRGGGGRCFEWADAIQAELRRLREENERLRERLKGTPGAWSGRP